jgi:hypothetical protein
MFPNVRLLIVALFASIVTLGCGFGVFAAFGVNHAPLSRLPANTAPLRLVATEPAPASAALSWGAPIGSRITPSDPHIVSFAPAPELEHHEGIGIASLPADDPQPISLAPPPPAQELTGALGAAAPPATVASAPQTPAQEIQRVQAAHDPQISETTKPSEPAPAATAAVEPAAQAPSVEQPATEPDIAHGASAPSAPAENTQPIEAAATAPVPDAKPGEVADKLGVPAPGVPGAIAAATPPSQTPVTEAPAQAINPAPDVMTPGAAAPPAQAGRRAPARLSRAAFHRTVRRVRLAAWPLRRRTAPASRFTQFKNQNPETVVFTSAPPAQQPATRTRSVRRTAKNTTAGLPSGSMDEH